MNQSLTACAAALLVFTQVSIGALHAGDYVFTKVIDNNDPVPGGDGQLFNLANGSGAIPGLDNGIITFNNFEPGNLTSLWSFNIDEGRPRRIVDPGTTVPGAGGKFNSTNPHLVENGFVIFNGRGTKSSDGLYAVPASGGAVVKIVDRSTAVDGGTLVFDFNNGSYFSASGGQVAFNSSLGVFVVNRTGTNLHLFGNSETKIKEKNYIFEAHWPTGGSFLAGEKMIFVSSNTFGQSSIYQGPRTGLTVNANNFVNNATRIASVNTGYDIFGMNSPKINGNSTVFGGTKQSDGRYGIWSRVEGADVGLVTTKTAVPGGPGTFVDIGNNGADLARDPAALESGQFLFHATFNKDQNGTPQQNGIFMTPANGTGPIRRILASGDPSPSYDSTVSDAIVGPASLQDDQFATQIVAGNRGLYLATPKSRACDLRSEITTNALDIEVGKNVTYSLVITNRGSAAARLAKAILTLPKGVRFVSSAPAGTSAGREITYDVGSVPVNGSFSVTVVAKVLEAGTLTASLYASSPTPDPLLANNHGFATTGTPHPARKPYNFRIIVDTETTIPDRPKLLFGLPAGSGATPALSGGKLVFLATESGKQSIWSAAADLAGEGFERLVGAANSIPAGNSKFEFFSNLRLKNGTAAFLGVNGSVQEGGIYAVPADGGDITRVVSTTSAVPGGPGKFEYSDFIQNGQIGSISDGFVLFGGNGGIYSYLVDSGTAKVVVYPGSSFPLANYGFGAVGPNGFPNGSGTHVAFFASEVFGRGSVRDTWSDDPNPKAAANANDLVPPKNIWPFDASSFSSILTEGSQTLFVGSFYQGTNPSPIRGIFLVKNGTIERIVDSSTDIPGSAGKFRSDSFRAVAFSSGEVVFTGADSNGVPGIYSVRLPSGTLTKILKEGDIIRDRFRVSGLSADQSPIGFNSLEQGRLVMRIGPTTPSPASSNPES